MRLALASTAGMVVAATAATMLWPPRPALVWNLSASSPLGLYRVTAPGQVRPGETVVAWPPAAARRLAAERRYLPANVPLVKEVAAAAGDRVCALGEIVTVNGRFAALRWREDPSGRPLPWWSGCVRLDGDQLLLLMRGGGDSFDGRYFGVTSRRQLVGRARHLWGF
jgi:conjugative transfer signal peptidase TraF